MRIIYLASKAYEAAFPNLPKEILGIGYRFEGTGSVEYVRLARLNGEPVLANDFN